MLLEIYKGLTEIENLNTVYLLYSYIQGFKSGNDTLTNVQMTRIRNMRFLLETVYRIAFKCFSDLSMKF